MTQYVISNEANTVQIVRQFETRRDAITWTQNTQDMSQTWNVDRLAFLIDKTYRKEET